MRLQLPRYNEDHHVSTNNYLLLFVALTGLLIFPSFGFLLGQMGVHLFDIFYSLVIFSGIYIVTQSRTHLRIGIFLGLIILISFWGRHTLEATALDGTQVKDRRANQVKGF